MTHLKATKGLWQDALLAMAGGLLGGSCNNSDKRDYQGQNNSNGVHREKGKLIQELFKSSNQQHVGLTRCGVSDEREESARTLRSWLEQVG